MDCVQFLAFLISTRTMGANHGLPGSRQATKSTGGYCTRHPLHSLPGGILLFPPVIGHPPHCNLQFDAGRCYAGISGRDRFSVSRRSWVWKGRRDCAKELLHVNDGGKAVMGSEMPSKDARRRRRKGVGNIRKAIGTEVDGETNKRTGR